MAKFFFHFRQNGILEEDTLGIEFQSVETAYLSTFEAARGIWHDLLSERVDPASCCFEVHDGDGKPLFELPFAEVLEVCKHRPARPAERPYIQVMREIQATHSRAQHKRHEVKLELDKARAGLAECTALVRRLGATCSVDP